MNILIIGATSAIARSVSRLYAAENMRLCLLGRDEKRLNEAAADLRIRGAGAVETLTYNAEKTSEHSMVIDSAIEFLGSIDIALICHGQLPSQKDCQENYEKAEAAIRVNGLSVISFLNDNIHVVDVRPGLVDSPMTSKFKKGPLWSSPESIATTIFQGIHKKKHTIYAPFYWRFIMLLVCIIPEFIFKRIKI